MPHKHRALAAAIAAGFATLIAVSGCGGGSKFVGGGSPTSRPAVTPPATSATTPAPNSTGTPASGTTKPATTGTNSSGTVKCHVTSLELLHDLTGNGGMYQSLGRPAKLGTPVCVGDYAMARGTALAGGGDPVQVLFHYSTSKKTWIVVAGGSAVDCSAFLSSAQAKQMPGCARS
ncbi:MAG TPA: hypothetical protein VH442_04120 [Micromonosporaceae bacterium]